MQLQWTYPLLDTQDCAPSTFGVSVTLLSGDAPSPPAMVTVQGQDGVNLAGLFPDTRYSIVVTAFINGLGTPSLPVQVTTGPEGPAAPTQVHTTTDDTGNWTITWSSCGGVAQGCVPAASWTVIPTFCDGAGLSGTPPAISITGDPTLHTFTATYPGSDALLGRGLSFQVEGIGGQGAVGSPGRDGGCSYSWSPPAAAALTLRSSQPAATSVGGTSTTTVSLDLGSDPVRAAGGVGAQFTYQLLSGGSVVQTSGPTSATSVTFAGIATGTQYSAQAVVSPPRHPEAAVTVGPQPVQPAYAAWPTIGVAAGVVDNGSNNATLTVAVTGLSSADAHGERFDLVNSALVCGGGNTAMPLAASGIDPSQGQTFSVPRLTYNGPCAVHLQLAQDPNYSTNPPLFGAGTTSSAATSATITIDPPVLVGVSAADFSAVWSGTTADGTSSVVRVSYTGSDPDVLQGATNWSVSVSDDGGTTTCGSSSAALPADVTINQLCVDAQGGNSGAWSATIRFTFFGAPEGPYIVSPVSGGPPATYPVLPPAPPSTPAPTPSPSPDPTPTSPPPSTPSSSSPSS